MSQIAGSRSTSKRSTRIRRDSQKSPARSEPAPASGRPSSARTLARSDSLAGHPPSARRSRARSLICIRPPCPQPRCHPASTGAGSSAPRVAGRRQGHQPELVLDRGPASILQPTTALQDRRVQTLETAPARSDAAHRCTARASMLAAASRSTNRHGVAEAVGTSAPGRWSATKRSSVISDRTRRRGFRRSPFSLGCRARCCC